MATTQCKLALRRVSPPRCHPDPAVAERRISQSRARRTLPKLGVTERVFERFLASLGMTHLGGLWYHTESRSRLPIFPDERRSNSKLFSRLFSVNPNAIYDAEPEHDHQSEGSAIADQGQWHTGNWQDRDGHSDVLENMGEDQRGNPDNKQ